MIAPPCVAGEGLAYDALVEYGRSGRALRDWPEPLYDVARSSVDCFRAELVVPAARRGAAGPSTASTSDRRAAVPRVRRRSATDVELVGSIRAEVETTTSAEGGTIAESGGGEAEAEPVRRNPGEVPAAMRKRRLSLPRPLDERVRSRSAFFNRPPNHRIDRFLKKTSACPDWSPVAPRVMMTGVFLGEDLLAAGVGRRGRHGGGKRARLVRHQSSDETTTTRTSASGSGDRLHRHRGGGGDLGTRDPRQLRSAAPRERRRGVGAER